MLIRAGCFTAALLPSCSRWLFSNIRKGNPPVPQYFRSHAADFSKISARLEDDISCLEGLPRFPSVDSLIDLLQRCRQEENARCAKRLHAYMQRKNLLSHKSLGNYLVSTLADCNCLVDAQQVFDELDVQNVYSYNSLILAYVKRGNPRHVLQIHHEMQRDGVQPTTHTYVALLKACSALQDHDWGQRLQEEISVKGLQKDYFVGNALVTMLGKCGSLKEAEEAFDKLLIRDVVSWSAMMAGYSTHGDHGNVLGLFTLMQSNNVSPNIVTFLCALKSCGILKDTNSGYKIYCQAVKMGLENDLSLRNSSIDMFCKCDNIVEARSLFDKMSLRDMVSWNIMIAGYVEYGLGNQALALFKELLLGNLRLDDVSLLCGLRAFASTGNFSLGQVLHSDVLERGMEGDLQMGNTLMDMYGKCGQVAEATSVFDKLPNRNEASWTTMITCYVQHEYDAEALYCFKNMQLESIPTDAVILTCSLNACSRLGATAKGQEIHSQVAKFGLENDIHLGTTLVDMYGEFGLLAEARSVFDGLPARNVLSWSALIKGYGINNEGGMAQQCFQDMKEEGVKPDIVACTSLLVACSQNNSTSEGMDFFQLIDESPEYYSQTTYHLSCALDLLARAGHINEAVRLLDAMQFSPSKEMWRALLSACKLLGRWGWDGNA